MPITYELTTAPAAGFIPLEDMKKQMYVDHTGDDAYINDLILVVTNIVQEQSQIWFAPQTWTLFLDSFPNKINPLSSEDNHSSRNFTNVIQLLRSPAVAITAINYTDTAGAPIVLNASQYTLDNKSKPARLVPSFGNDWPDTQEILNAVDIEFTVGYTDLADMQAKRPELIHAVKLIVGLFYENREDAIDVKLEKIPTSAMDLIGIGGVHTYT